MGNKSNSCSNDLCFMRRIGSIEMQLILQFLHVSSKLLTARCCTTLWRDAAGPFSWGEYDYFDVVFAKVDHIVRLRETRLLRQAPLLLHWTSSAHDLLFTGFGFHVRGLQVHCSGGEFHADQLGDLLQRPDCFRDLQVLRFDTDPFTDSALTRAIGALPVLCSLQMHSVRGQGLMELADLSSFTELRVLSAAITEEDEDNLCKAIARCTHLHKLHLTHVESVKRPFQRVLSFQNLRQLRHLCLHHFDVTHVRVSDLSATFAALAQLQTLDLRRIREIDRLLDHLPRAVALTDLTIECGAWDGEENWNPSKKSLRSLQQALPHLRTTLFVVPSVEDWLCDFVEQYEYSVYASSALRDQLTARWHWLQKKAVRIPRVRLVALSRDK